MNDFQLGPIEQVRFQRVGEKRLEYGNMVAVTRIERVTRGL